jgi:hypothetical protein
MQSKKRVQIIMTLWTLVLAFQLFSSLSIASNLVHQPNIHVSKVKASEDFIYDDYFIITAQTKAAVDVDLLKFKHVLQTFPLPAVHYDRKKHFGGWIHRTDDQSCLDTRGLVLVRDSQKPVQTSSCRVLTGEWYDPYTDNSYSTSSNIQIDHVVPLKHAYMTGAFEWDNKKRCQYANYMGNNFHLLSVYGSENMRKGDRGPHEYLPPNQKFTCQYLKDWLEIKYLWSLRLTPKETLKINQIITQEHCDSNTFQVPRSDIAEQIKIMKQTENICVGVALAAF